MSNVNIDEAFGGIEDATVEDRFPAVPPLTKGVGVVDLIKVFKSKKKSGLCFAIEFLVEESNNPECRVGMKYSKIITKLDSSDAGTKSLKQGNVISFLAAVFKKDEKDPEFRKALKGMIAYCRDRGAANGRKFAFETGAVEKTDGGFDFVRMMFRQA